MRAIIYGASIAGFAAAWWLSRTGWDILVIDPRRQPCEGCTIDFVVRDKELEAQMGLASQLNAIDCRIPQVAWIDLEEKDVARLTFFELQAILGEQVLILPQNDLARVLFHNLPPHISVRFDCSITAIRHEESGVWIDLSDNRRERADVLVGADGVSSRVRDLAFGVPARYVRYLGCQAAGFVVRDHALARKLGSDLRLITAPEREAGLCPLPGGRVSASFVHRISPEDRSPDPVDELRHLYRDFGPLVAAVLDSARGTHIHCDQSLQVVLPHWYKDRVVLLGDACHAGSVPAAQGALLAMMAARTLAVALSLEGTLEAAFESYEQSLKPAMDGGQANGWQMAKWLPARPDGQILTRAARLRLADLPWVGPLLKGMFPSGRGSASLQG